jgi:hypothetical protein
VTVCTVSRLIAHGLGVVSGRVCIMVIVALLLGWDGEAACVINVEEMTFEFVESWWMFVVHFGSTNIGIKALV